MYAQPRPCLKRVKNLRQHQSTSLSGTHTMDTLKKMNCYRQKKKLQMGIHTLAACIPIFVHSSLHSFQQADPTASQAPCKLSRLQNAGPQVSPTTPQCCRITVTTQRLPGHRPVVAIPQQVPHHTQKKTMHMAHRAPKSCNHMDLR
jgi:hypothetical protein